MLDSGQLDDMEALARRFPEPRPGRGCKLRTGIKHARAVSPILKQAARRHLAMPNQHN